MQKRKFFLLTLCSLLFLNLSSIAQESMVARIRQLLPAYEQLNQFSGSAVLCHKGKPVYQQSFGLADREKGIRNDNNTLYNIGSIGKMFTSVAIMQLVEKGKLKLDAPIATYLPEYKLPNADKITITHLLTHTSGYGTYMRATAFDNKKVYSLDELVTLIGTLPLKFDTPGTNTWYSNSAFVILGRLVEIGSGLPWWEYFQQNIFKPLRLTHVYRLLPGEAAPLKAVGYSFNAAGEFENVTSDPMPYSDGGLYATAADLATFAAAVQGGKLVSRTSFETMVKTYNHFEAFQCDMGLGWEIQQKGGKPFFTKGGNVFGFSGQLMLMPNEYTLVLLSNLTTGAFDVADPVVEEMYGIRKAEPKLAATNFLYQQIHQKGWAVVGGKMKAYEEENGYPYNFRDYVNVALAVKEKGEFKLAAEILEAVLAEQSRYVFGFHQLGEVYEQLHEKGKAMACYQKALAIDPTNEMVSGKLKKLQNG